MQDSTFRRACGLSYSESASITGQWIHLEQPLVRCDGGHGMFFLDKKGTLNLTIHAPDKTPLEQPVFFPAEDLGDEIVLRRVKE